jgi:hypothetical protein
MREAELLAVSRKTFCLKAAIKIKDFKGYTIALNSQYTVCVAMQCAIKSETFKQTNVC